MKRILLASLLLATPAFADSDGAFLERATRNAVITFAPYCQPHERVCEVPSAVSVRYAPGTKYRYVCGRIAWTAVDGRQGLSAFIAGDNGNVGGDLNLVDKEEFWASWHIACGE